MATDDDRIFAQIAASLRTGAELRLALIDTHLPVICLAATAMAKCLRNRGTLLLFGNGQCAADAQHVAADFVARFRTDRVPLPAFALTTEASALPDIGSDDRFDRVFERQVRALGCAGDIAIGISTCGRSKNVLHAISSARELGLITIGLSGGDGGPLAELVDFAITVPGRNTALIRECQITIEHILSGVVDSLLLDSHLEAI
jgi:D-sedoheptulose 7-phosphate isomerase